MLTDIQWRVLRYLRERGGGAIRFEGAWIWPADVRADRRLAERIYRAITD